MESCRETRKEEAYYQVVKSLRNWAIAKERKAESRGRLEGIIED